MLIAAAPVHALQGDRIRPSVGVVTNYYSNLFFLDNRAPVDQLSFLKNGQKSDWSRGLRVGLDADIAASRQTFLLRSNVTRNNFSTYNALDNMSYDLRGTWNWVVGSRWDGEAGATVSESLGSFIDTRSSGKNMRKTNTYSASAMYRFSYDWKLRTALGYYELQNSDPLFLSANRRETSYELGSRYYSKDEDNFLGFNLRGIDGVFPNRQQLLGSTSNDVYRQFTAEGVVNWRYSPLTSLEGAIGWTNRLHDQVSIRNFSGLTGRLVWTYGLTGATSLNATVFREITTPETVGANYALTQGWRAGPVWRYGEKLTLKANAGFSNRRFLGDPLTAVTGKVREDNLWVLSTSAVWSPRARLEVDASLSYDKRQSNAILFDFTALTLLLSAQYIF